MATVADDRTYLVRRMHDNEVFEVTDRQANELRNQPGFEVLGSKATPRPEPLDGSSLSGEFLCAVCNKGFATKMALQGHLMSHKRR